MNIFKIIKSIKQFCRMKSIQRINKRHFEDWSKAKPFKAIPGPTEVTLAEYFNSGGESQNFLRNEIFKLVRQEYGDIVYFPAFFGNPESVAIFNPSDFEKVFRLEGKWPIRFESFAIEHFRTVERADYFTPFAGLDVDQNEKWKEFRSVVNPVLLKPRSIMHHIEDTDRISDDFISRIYNIRDPNTKEVPAKFGKEIHRWLIESLGKITLGINLGMIKDFNSDVRLNAIIEGFEERSLLSYEIFNDAYEISDNNKGSSLNSKLDKIVKIQNNLVNIFDGYFNRVAEQLETQPESFNNLNLKRSIFGKLFFKHKHIARVMALDMFFVGVETTSSTLISCLFNLAKSPAKQEKLREELLTILPNKNSNFNEKNMHDLPYLRACIKESLRISPLVNANFRVTTRDLVLSGYHVPKGTFIFMVSDILLRDNKNYVDANVFLPERWLSSSVGTPYSAKNAHPFTYLPFGFGPRNCVGKKIAEMKMEVIVGKLIRNFHLDYKYSDFKYLVSSINVPSGKFKFKFSEV